MSNIATQFKPGQCGNPNGRPKRDWTVQSLIEEAMEEQDETGVPAKKIIYKKLVALAKKGDIQAIKEVGQRLDGMPKQTNDLNIKELPKPLLNNLNVSNNNSSQETEITE